MNKTLLLVFSIAFIIGTSYGMHNPVLPLFAKNEIGATYSELGLIGLANFIPYMFIPLFVGILLDRFNNGYLLSIGVIINSISIFLLSSAESVPEVMIFRAMTGFAHAFFWPPSSSIISKVSKKHDRVKNIGKFTGLFISGFMIGPLIGGYILDFSDESYRLLFEITSFVLGSAIIAAIWTTKRRVTVHQEKVSIINLKEITKFKTVIAIILFCNFVFGTILIIYPAYLNDQSFSAVEVEILFFVFGISRVVTLIFTGRLANHSGKTIIFACLSITTGLFLSFYTDNVFVFGAALLSMGFGFGIFFPLTLEVVLSRTRENIRGSIIGAYETIFGIGWVIGPLSAGLISEHFGNHYPYIMFFVIGIGISIMAFVKRENLTIIR
ncbi:MAG: MFS transporter [Nitrosopumilaceae archaeon]|jgi:MFS family permease